MDESKTTGPGVSKDAEKSFSIEGSFEPKTRSYSFSNILKARGDKVLTKSDINRVKLSEDCDRYSLMSDSGLSDMSQTTEGSVNSVVSTGIVVGNPGMRKNFSTNDVANMKSHAQPLSDHDSKLPNFMLWKWLSHQTYGNTDMLQQKDSISDKAQPSSCSVSAMQMKMKKKWNLRDLNAITPTGW